MAKGKLLLGLDIGSSSAKICQLRDTRGSYSVEIIDREMFPVDAIVDGSILDRMSVTRGIRNLLNRNKVRQKQCAIAISGYSVIVKRVRMANLTDEELRSSPQMRWEVEQQIPLEYDDIVYDTVVLGRSPAQNSMDILLVAVKREIVNDYISVARDAGLEVKVVDVASFALHNMVETVYGAPSDGQCVGVINIGAAVTSMTMMIDGITAFTRDITIGGNQITEEIQKKLVITREEAEAFKTGNVAEGTAMIPREVEEITSQVSEMIANEIKRSIAFFYETSGDVKIRELILCGGVIKNPTTLSILERTLVENIRVANPFENLQYNTQLYTRESLDDLSVESSIAFGLALRRSVED